MIDCATQLYIGLIAFHLIVCVFVSRQKRRLSFRILLDGLKRIVWQQWSLAFFVRRLYRLRTFYLNTIAKWR